MAANEKLLRLKKMEWVFTLLIALLLAGTANGDSGCTIGAIHGSASTDGRPILFKVRDTDEARQQLIYVSGTPYNYIGICDEGGGIFMGLNEAGIASGNSLVNPLGLPNTNSSTQGYILRNFNNLDQIRNYFQLKIEPYSSGGRGCFPFIDSAGNAIMFELNGTDWWLEYNSMDPNRDAQALLGFVVRANEFHERFDGTDDINITGGRYESGTFNIAGLHDVNMLCDSAIIQGNEGPNNGYEVVRYGPGRELATIARSTNRSSMIVHGVAAGENPILATAWVMLGQSNYSIAVPAWVQVSDIPHCLSSGDMYDRALSLYNKGNESIIQASIFPFETHVFSVVNNTLLPHWRNNGAPSTNEMTRIEHQIANDAYSLLDCLDNHQNDNKSPIVIFNALPNGLTLNFKLTASDSDGTINNIEWNFGDNQTSQEETPSHTYTEPGIYLISCTVTDDDGVSITDWKYYVVPINCDIAGDDGIVDIHDLAKFSVYWLATDCGEPNWCQGVDLDRNTMVNFVDFAIFSNNWLWCRGDLDSDGTVNFKDYAVFSNNWMIETCCYPDWCGGSDFDHSGMVDFNDLFEFVSYWLWR